MEKLLVSSDFSFFHNVFKSLELQTRKNQNLFGKGLTEICVTETASMMQAFSVLLVKMK